MKQFFYGVIEGFYGRQWSWKDREHYAGFLSRHGFDCYIYAPKGDRYLRADWRLAHPSEQMEKLAALGQRYHNVGMRWGIGLSALGLISDYNTDDRCALQKKVRDLNALEPDILCILFDDIRGDFAHLANRQLAITQDILAVSDAPYHIVCPTYYSFDPVLEQVFGQMPAAYLETLGRGLDAEIDVFWTGNYVISPSYHRDDLHRIATLLNRPPVLWDNYPVNDGRKTSQYLHLKPYTGRPYQLKQWARGHIVNPMNQPRLSQLVLQSLQQVYQLDEHYDVDTALNSGLIELLDKPLAQLIKRDWQLFQQTGLVDLSAAKRNELIECYQSYDDVMAREIVDWLQGGYQFDPECLTE